MTCARFFDAIMRIVLPLSLVIVTKNFTAIWMIFFCIHRLKWLVLTVISQRAKSIWYWQASAVVRLCTWWSVIWIILEVVLKSLCRLWLSCSITGPSRAANRRPYLLVIRSYCWKRGKDVSRELIIWGMILTESLHSVAEIFLGTEQTCAVKGRIIQRNLHLIRPILEVLKDGEKATLINSD